VKDKALEAIRKQSPEDCSVGNAALPLVSIIVTNYNYQRFLKECVDSCLAQDYPYTEVIVVDDCSTDNSAVLLKSYGDKIRIIRHKENRGQLASFFSGLAEAKGEFTVFVDADDFLDNDAVSAHLYLQLFVEPPVAFTCLHNRQVSENSSILSSFHMDFHYNGKVKSYIPPRVIHTPSWSWSTTSAMMFRTDLLRLIKTENTDDFRICADYYIVHFANLLGGSLLYNSVKVSYRRHGKNHFSKNFIIGGHKPTGDMRSGVHPSHTALQKEILSRLILDADNFLPYFPSIERYCESLLFVADAEFIKNNFSLDDEIINILDLTKGKVEQIKNNQIEIKKAAIEAFEEERYKEQIENIRDYLKKLYI
jgi:glycosyltransferase involved in cell wall biosynthesis